jgi:hypothetical protein
MPTALTWCCRAEGKRVFQFCKKCCRRTAKAGRNCNSYCNGCGGCGPSPPAWTGVVCESAPSFRPASSLRYNRFLYFLKILVILTIKVTLIITTCHFRDPLWIYIRFLVLHGFPHISLSNTWLSLSLEGLVIVYKVLRISKTSIGRAYSNSSERMGGRRCRQIHPSKCGWVA